MGKLSVKYARLFDRRLTSVGRDARYWRYFRYAANFLRSPGSTVGDNINRSGSLSLFKRHMSAGCSFPAEHASFISTYGWHCV